MSYLACPTAWLVSMTSAKKKVKLGGLYGSRPRRKVREEIPPEAKAKVHAYNKLKRRTKPSGKIRFKSNSGMDRIRTRERHKTVRLGQIGEVGNEDHFQYYVSDPGVDTCVDRTNPGPPYKVGWGMTIRKAYIKTYPSGVFRSRIGLNVVNTRFRPSYFGTSPTVVEPTWSIGATSDHAKAWRKYRPGKPVANVGQFIGELTRLPTLPLKQIVQARGTLNRFRAMGSEYLNIQFGWKPFVKDLQDMYKLVTTLDATLAQLRRDNGQPIRRRGGVRKTVLLPTTIVQSTGSYLYPILNSGYYQNSSQGKRIVTETYEERSWFSARFRYFVKNIDSVEWEDRAILALFGLNPTPSLLWEVMPWSWLVDWGANVGDVLSNLSSNAVDNLVADYAFLMTQRTFTRSVQESTVLWNSYAQRYETISARADFVSTVKMRERASPFGFGLVPGDLTGRQASILGALGISRRW